LVLGLAVFRLTVAVGAVLATVTVFDWRVPLTVPSLGVASTTTMSPLLGLIGLIVAPVQVVGTKLAFRSRVTLRTPAATKGLVFVWIVQMSPPRLTFHVQATETVLPSASAVVVEAVSRSLVLGDAGLKDGVVAVGAVFDGVSTKLKTSSLLLVTDRVMDWLVNPVFEAVKVTDVGPLPE
jgi:hypothetical protein